MKSNPKLIAILLLLCVLVLAFTVCAGCTNNQSSVQSPIQPTVQPTVQETQNPTSSTTKSLTQYSITVLDKIMGSDAENLIKAANRYNDLPSNGMIAYLVKYKVTCDSLASSSYRQENGDLFTPNSDLKLYIDGIGYNPTSAVMPEGYPKISQTTMFEGDSEGGWAYFIAPSSTDAYLRIKSSSSNSNEAKLPAQANVQPTAQPTVQETQKPTSSSTTKSLTQYSVTVLDKILGSNAENLMKSANRYNDLPSDGMIAYLVKYKVTCDSLASSSYRQENGDLFTPSSDLKLYIDGIGYKPTSAVMPEGYPKISQTTMFEGDSEGGWAYFIAPSSSDAYLRIKSSSSNSNEAKI